jgi:UDP-N-acetylglucosamine 4,6-dehydratase/5-epimerase
MKINNFKSILVTGGTGSFGKAFVRNLIKTNKNLKRLIIFSRDEWKQSEMEKEFPTSKYKFIRYFIGDVRNLSRLKRAFKNIEVVVHAAALKQVPAAEYNPTEFIETNIIGAQNIIEASIDCNVKKVIALSTDKAAAPLNLYGATKLCSDKLFLAANNYSGSRIVFSICRYGNVMGTRGSVIPFFFDEAKKGILPITDKKMTRFNITLKESIELVTYAINNSLGKETFVPKIPSINIIDLAKAIAPNCKIKVVGIRPGEKLHEEMITVDASINTIENSKYYIILPVLEKKYQKMYLKKYNAKKVKKRFSYNSFDNNKFLDISQIRQAIKINLKSDFKPI